MNDAIFTQFKTPYSEQNVKATIINQLNDGFGLDATFDLPTVGSLVNADEKLCDDLVNKYHETVPNSPYGEVGYAMKLVQGTLLSGLVYAYHKSSGKITLHTGNPQIINSLDSVNEKNYNIEQTAKLNSTGELNSMRVDITYNSPVDFNVKVTKLTSKTRLTLDDYIFVPLESASIVAQLIGTYLSKGKTLFVQETKAGVIRNRFISQNAAVLQKYSDNAEFSAEVSKRRYTQLGNHKIYVPIVGATSEKYGLVGIDLLMLDKMASVADNGKLVEVSVFAGGMKDSIISLIMRELKESYVDERIDLYNKHVDNIVDILTQAVFLEMLSSIEEPENMPEAASLSLGGSYMLIRNMDDEQLKKLWDSMKNEESKWINDSKPQEIMSLTSDKWEKVDIPQTREEFYNLLNSGVYRITRTRKSGTLSVDYVTTDSEVLKKAYGDDYFVNYESVGVRLKAALNDLENKVRNGDQVAELYGFEELKGVPQNFIPSVFENKVMEVYGYKKKNSYSDQIIIARMLFASKTDSKVDNYYTSFNLGTVAEIIKVS